MSDTTDQGAAAEAGAVTIYTDGGCSGNPGPGGWGAVLIFRDETRELSGGEAMTTNNRMELTAAIEALGTLKRPCTVNLHTDSQYVRNGITSWIKGWKRNGWRTASKEPVKNAELWRALDAALGQHKIVWHWVRGHAGDPGNERADALATAGMAPFLRGRSGSTPPAGLATPARARLPVRRRSAPRRSE